MPEIFPTIKNREGKNKKPAIPGGKSNHALSAFMVRPGGIRFETQEAKEEIILLLRQHPVTNVGWIAVTLFLIIIPAFFFPFTFSANIVPRSMPLGYFVILPLLWYLGTAGFAFTNFLFWYFNVYIVTNQRVIDIDWISILYKELSSTQLAKIQDVTYKQGGLLDSFFDFGTVYIQTAGTETNFEFEHVPHPEHVVRQIDEIIEQIKPGGNV